MEGGIFNLIELFVQSNAHEMVVVHVVKRLFHQCVTPPLLLFIRARLQTRDINAKLCPNFNLFTLNSY